MADDADIAAEMMDYAVSQILKGRQNNTPKKFGSKVCIECEEQIPDARRQLGFQLCVTCAEESERRNALFAT